MASLGDQGSWKAYVEESGLLHGTIELGNVEFVNVKCVFEVDVLAFGTLEAHAVSHGSKVEG